MKKYLTKIINAFLGFTLLIAGCTTAGLDGLYMDEGLEAQALAGQGLQLSEEDQSFTLYVRDLDGKTMVLDAAESTILAALKEQLYDRTGLAPEDQRLVYGTKELTNPERSLADYGIEAGATLQLQGRLKGAGRDNNMTTAFVSLKDGVDTSFSSGAPAWRIVCRGLNLEGRCTNPSCKAYRNKVWAQVGFDYGKDAFGDPINSFEIGMLTENAKCPICRDYLDEVYGCGFNKCSYSYAGCQLKQKGKIITGKGESFNPNGFEKHSAGSNGEFLRQWKSLKIKVWRQRLDEKDDD